MYATSLPFDPKSIGMAVEPIERRALHHFLPGSRVLSYGARAASPESIAQAAVDLGCSSVVIAQPSPRLQETAAECRRRGLLLVSSGVSDPEVLAQVNAASLGVVEARGLVRPACWVELVAEVPRGEEDLRALVTWVRDEYGADVPLHLRPGRACTSEVLRARDVAMERGLRWVYAGDLREPIATSTWCPACEALLISRRGPRPELVGVLGATCTTCGEPVPGKLGR